MSTNALRAFSADYLYGLFAVRHGCIPQSVMDEAIQIRLRSRPIPRLANVLNDLGSLSHEEQDRLNETCRSLLLGQIGIDRGLVRPRDVIQALAVQHRCDPPPLLGRILVEQGALPEDRLRILLTEQEEALTRALQQKPCRPAAPPAPRPRGAVRRETTPEPARPSSWPGIPVSVAAALAFVAWIGWRTAGQDKPSDPPPPTPVPAAPADSRVEGESATPRSPATIPGDRQKARPADREPIPITTPAPGESGGASGVPERLAHSPAPVGLAAPLPAARGDDDVASPSASSAPAPGGKTTTSGKAPPAQRTTVSEFAATLAPDDPPANPKPGAAPIRTATREELPRRVLLSRPTRPMDIKSGLKTRPTVPGLRVDTFTVGADHLIPGLHRDPRGGTMPYRFFAPRPAAQRSKVPLVLFLHGLGEAGTDNLLQLSKNREPLVFVQPAVQANRPCFFVAPQHPPGHDWFGGDYERPSDSLRMAVAIVDRIAADYPSVDPDRIYVTGLSSGGIGAWDAMGKYPHKFAAAVPISAGCDPLVLRVKQGVSVWAFYNEGDELF